MFYLIRVPHIVNPTFAKKLASKPSEMDMQLYVTIPLGSTYYTDVVFKNYTIQLEGRVLPVDLVQRIYKAGMLL